MLVASRVPNFNIMKQETHQQLDNKEVLRVTFNLLADKGCAKIIVQVETTCYTPDPLQLGGRRADCRMSPTSIRHCGQCSKQHFGKLTALPTYSGEKKPP